MSNPNQRTKGNTKPSNSERAARLLSSNQFVSFSQASQTLSGVYASTVSSVPDSDSSSFKYGIGSDFQVIFKHMTKKDINTKLKALQDFNTLCSSKENEELLETASYWYRIYRKLSNVIDWRVRQEVHNAHYHFISKFDRDTIDNSIQTFGGANAIETDSDATSEVSFQNLITMPAIMWTSCFDVYTQAAESAKKAFDYLHPTENSRIDFILNNYDSILNYCAYCIFDKIPIKLFYTNPLPTDSVKVFEEHLLVTSLRGLASLVNELICFYLEIENGTDDTLQGRVFQCLEQIFSRLNTEFGKSKFPHLNKPKQAQNGEEIDAKENNDDAFLSKKDKKKLKKEEKDKENALKGQNKSAKGHCKFWTYFNYENTSIRVSIFHALNSITRLTTMMFENSQLKESSIFDQLNTSNLLWFKLYKTNLYENVFKSFIDPVPDIRGLVWLLGTHILSFKNLYKPWSVLNHDKWLKETLVTFVSNGMKTTGGLVDFGLFNIGLQNCQRLYPEFFVKKYSHLSGLQLTCDNYAELDILANVKLVIVFADAFNNYQEDEFNLKIYQTLLYSLKDAFPRTFLQKDLDFLIEIYFNLIYHLMIKCLPLKTKVQRQEDGSFVEEHRLNILFEEVFQTHICDLVVSSLDISTNDLLFNSHIYLNLLLLVNYTNDYYKDICQKETDDNAKILLQVNNIFKFNVQKLYSNLFSLINSELSLLINDKSQSKFQLNRLLRFLNDAILFRFDGYFSSEFYYSKNNTNYDKNALKLVRTCLSKETSNASISKRVNFDTDGSDEAVETESTTGDWGTSRQRQSIFCFSLANSNYSERSKRVSIHLLNEYNSLLDEVISIMVTMIKLFDHKMEQFEQSALKNKADDNIFLIIQHVQYILRTLNSQQLSALFSKLQDQTDVDSSLIGFVQNYLIKWINSLYTYLSQLDEQPSSSLRFYVMISSKIFDILLICLSTQEETASLAVLNQIFSNMKPFAFCVFFNHLNRLSTLPVSLLYSPTISQFKKYFSESAQLNGTLLLSQIDVLFEHSQSKTLECDILNNLLQSFLYQDKDSNSCRVEQIGRVLAVLLQHLQKYGNDHSKCESFLLDFPLLCREIYSYLFMNAQLLNQIDNFENIFVSFCKLFFQQMFTAAISSENNVKLKAFIPNAVAFWKFSLEKLFETLPKYETSLIILVQDLTNIVVDEIILGQFWNNSNFNRINCEVKQFLKILFSEFSNVLPQLEKEDAIRVQKQFEQIQMNLYKKIGQKDDLFLMDNIYGYLYELENVDSNSLSRLYAIYDIFQSKEIMQTLEKLNDTDRLNTLLEDKLANFKYCLYVNNAQASIVHFLLTNVYQNSLFNQHFNCPQLLAKVEQSSFDILFIIRTLVRNLYHFDRFINFYFYQKNNSVKNECFDVYTTLKNEIGSIINVLKISLKKDSTQNSLLIQLIHFLICSDNNQDIYGLSYANFIIEKFFHTTNWMEVLNYIGIPTKLDTSKTSQIICLFIANTENISKVNEILAQALRFFESAAISESYSEPKSIESEDGQPKENKKNTLFDWSKLSIDDVNQTLVVIDFAFYKLKSLLSLEQSESILELKERLHNFLTLLCWGKLEKLFEPNIPQFSHSKYFTFLLNTQLITDAVQCLDGNTKSEHFSMFLSVLKSWIQILYTSLPEAIEKETPQQLSLLVMTSRIIHTLNLFGQKALTMSKNDDSQLEMIEMWRNFLAFDSFNMILPLFVVLNNSPKRNLIEQTYLKRLVQTMDFIDIECLQDISTLELNQYLLMFPDEKSQQRSLETVLNKFMENAHLNQTSNNSQTQSKNTTTLALTASNNYYEYLLSHATPLLLHSDFNWSLSAFQILTIMFQDLPWSQKGNKEKKNLSNVDDSLLSSRINSSLMEEEVIRIGPPVSFSNLLTKLDSVIEFILVDCEFGQSVMIDPNSDLYNYTFAYLLVWLLYLHLMDPFPMEDAGEARADLINFITERNLHLHLFDNLFHLMLNIEEDVHDLEQIKTENNECSTVEFLMKIKDLKDVQNLRNLISERDSNSLSKLSLCVYYQVLRYLPNLLRAWFSNLKPLRKQIVDDFTINNFSDLLIEKELDNFRTTDREKFGNIVIRTSKKANEITAVYSLREISFGIRFSFNGNYPLTPVGIECFNRSGVSEDRCRKWIHRLNTFFNKQNCSILNGIIMLRPNMDKFFEDIEECMICLFVLYGATSDLPRFKCPQCRKKFHWACIRKWFQTNDNNSSCPQCKFEFN